MCYLHVVYNVLSTLPCVVCVWLQSAPLLVAGLLPKLHQLMVSPDQELQQLGVQMLARCAAQMRKCGAVLSTSTNTGTATLTKQLLLPLLRRMARGQGPVSTGSQGNGAFDGLDDEDGGMGSLGLGTQDAGLVQVAPKAAKWAVFGLAACQDSSSTKQELQQIADELATSLDAAAADTAAKLQALSAVGRIMPGRKVCGWGTRLRFGSFAIFGGCSGGRNAVICALPAMLLNGALHFASLQPAGTCIKTGTCLSSLIPPRVAT
jgi:hypothetical protein